MHIEELKKMTIEEAVKVCREKDCRECWIFQHLFGICPLPLLDSVVEDLDAKAKEAEESKRTNN